MHTAGRKDVGMQMCAALLVLLLLRQDSITTQCWEAYLQALRVDSVASIFSIGGF
jgi:hypothetical protein